MVRILENDGINRASWDALLQASPVSSWFQSPQAYCFFDGLSFLEAFAFGVEGDDCLKGVVVGYVQKDGNRLKQFFSRRAIIIGGPLLSEDITDEEFSTLLRILKDKLGKKTIYLETRNLSDYSKWRIVYEECGFIYEPHLNFLVNCLPKENLWKNLKENRRRQIKKALAEGVRVEEASSEVEIRDFYYLLSDLYRTKVKTPLFPVDFFLEFYRKDCGKFFLVKDKSEVIGGIMCPVMDNRTIYELFVCGQDAMFKNKYPSVMATWAAMDYAANSNIALFDFMGAGRPNEAYGVREFKSKFGGELVEYGRYSCVCKPFLFAVGKLGVKILKRL